MCNRLPETPIPELGEEKDEKKQCDRTESSIEATKTPNTAPMRRSLKRKSSDGEKDEVLSAEQDTDRAEQRQFVNNGNKKARKNRCGHCNCRLSLVWQSIVCKCGMSFCDKHRHPVSTRDRVEPLHLKRRGHICSFNYCESAQKALGETLVRIDANSGLKDRI